MGQIPFKQLIQRLYSVSVLSDGAKGHLICMCSREHLKINSIVHDRLLKLIFFPNLARMK